MDKQHFEESIISTIKAISKQEKIDVCFDLENINFSKINQNSFNNKNIYLPKPSYTKSQHDLASPARENQGFLRYHCPSKDEQYYNNNFQEIRGFGDLAALYLKFHNPKIHQNLSDPTSQKLFDDFEKFRLIKEGCKEFKGIGFNLEQILQDCLGRINDYSFLPFLLLKNNSLQNQINGYKKIIGKELLNKIDQLEKLSNDQKLFADKTLEVIEFINNQQKDGEQTKNNKKSQEQQNSSKIINEENIETEEVQIEKEPSLELKSEETPENKEVKIFQRTPQEIDTGTEIEDLSSNSSNIKFIPEYKIFTKKFDQIVKAEDLVSVSELSNLRIQLDSKIFKLDKISKHLTAKLKRKLLAKKQIFFEFNKEEGLIDRKKICQIIAKQSSGNPYFTTTEDNYQNTVLSILLDNSGSMRGSPITMSAMATEVIAKIFEGFGIKTEILGFTTIDWRGGKSRKLWEEQGKDKNPGRLSDLRHIIYKNANQSFKKSKNNLALMLKDGILKENIDGEALIWAATRLKNRSEKRKILLVISDGTPVDDSTNSNNDHDVLSDHLHQTIQRLEKHSEIEIVAIGIGHNVGDFYKNSITIKNINELGDVMIDRICQII